MKWSDSNAAATEEFRVSPVDEGSSSARQKTDRAAAKHAGKATGGGAALQARKERHRSEKRQSVVKRVAEGMRRSILLHAISHAAVSIAERQIRVAQYRMAARFNLFRNWGGASMRDYRRIASTRRRFEFYARAVQDFSRDLTRPHPK